MIHADETMNQHFGSDPADIRIRINPEIRIRIPDHILALAEFALSACSCVCFIGRLIAQAGWLGLRVGGCLALLYVQWTAWWQHHKYCPGIITFLGQKVYIYGYKEQFS